MTLFKKLFERADVVSLVTTLVVLGVLSFFVDIDTLRDVILGAGIWAPVVFILTKILTIVIAPLSGAALYPLVGIAFGFWPSMLLILIGDGLGYSIAFFISRRWGQPVVLKLLSNKEEGLLPKIIEYAGTTRGMFHLCCTFFGFSEVIAYGAGLSTIRYPKFIAILMPLSMIGASILIGIGSTFGARGDSMTPFILVPLVMLGGGLIGFYFFVKKEKRKSLLDNKGDFLTS